MQFSYVCDHLCLKLFTCKNVALRNISVTFPFCGIVWTPNPAVAHSGLISVPALSIQNLKIAGS